MPMLALLFNLAETLLNHFDNTMPRKEINILAVNPGTKYLGLAVFKAPIWSTGVLRYSKVNGHGKR
jgi:hypothetical protein